RTLLMPSHSFSQTNKTTRDSFVHGGMIAHQGVTAVTDRDFPATYTTLVVAKLRKYAESAEGDRNESCHERRIV
ncbi:MAG TPA: hypothetical protein VMV98_00975, partial [Acidobacteriaceae bacterium]|nr:hypothetical protein [Acidobacteriaceae bacterium]